MRILIALWLLLALLMGVVGALAVDYGIVGSAVSHLGVTLPAIRRSTGDISVHGHHIRLIGDDGNFEFEHVSGEGVARFNAYVKGTPRRTPIAVGVPDGQDLVELIVRASPGTKDLQEWVVDGRVLAAVDRRGRLRLGDVTLSTAIRGGRVVLLATLPSGKQQVLGR